MAGNANSGRKSGYKPEYAPIAKKMCELGATDMEIADAFRVSVRTIYGWKHLHEDFLSALNAGKDKADERVVNSLFMRAVGYEQDAVKIFMPANAKEPVYAEYREKIAPDTTAAIFWLKNRQPDAWRDKQEHDVRLSRTNDLTDDELASIASGSGGRVTEAPPSSK